MRTLRLINNADTWFIGKGASGSVVWVRGDGSCYCCDSATARAIRMGTRSLNGLTLHKAASPPGVSPGSGSELAWFAGYHASNVLAPWLSEHQTLRLTRWPDFGRWLSGWRSRRLRVDLRDRVNAQYERRQCNKSLHRFPV